MIGVSHPMSPWARIGWLKFRIAEALGPGEHEVEIIETGRPSTLEVFGIDHDEKDRPSAVIEVHHPNIDDIPWNDVISWEDIWDAVRRQLPINSIPRPATEGEYQALKASIATFGSLQRVIVDEAGQVIAGRLRKRACAELGVQCPTEVIAGLSPDEKDQLAFELEYCRKHLTLPEKRQTAEFLLKANPRNSDRTIGRVCGLDHKTVGVVRDVLEERGEIPHVTQRQGGDGKTYKFSKIAANSKREEERAKIAFQTLGEDAPAKPLDLKRAELLARFKSASIRRAARKLAPHLPDDSIQIIHSDFRKLQIDDVPFSEILAALAA